MITESDGPARAAASWIWKASSRELPADVVNAARTCLIDWFACTLGGLQDPVVSILKRRIEKWSPSGSALLLTGGTCSPAFAAMLHSTAAHTTDFDDTHIWTDSHFSGPTWAAILSQISEHSELGDELMCKAFVAGFETGAKLGGRRLGHAMIHRGFQSTAMLGRLSSAAACGVIGNLDENEIAMALTIAGCQTAGLSTVAGTMMKPYQGGKAAFDGVISAELAAEGFTADPALFEKAGGSLGEKRIGGLARAYVQDGFAEFTYPEFETVWEILRNSTKPYPCLHSICPVIDAARDLSTQVKNKKIKKIRAYVGPSVQKIARFDKPMTSHEGRFSIQYCAALGLLGRSFAPENFEVEVMNSPELKFLVGITEVVPVEGRKMYNAAVDVTLESGEILVADVPLGRGHPGRPLLESELEEKFRMLVDPYLGRKTIELLRVIQRFPGGNSIKEAINLVQNRP